MGCGMYQIPVNDLHSTEILADDPTMRGDGYLGYYARIAGENSGDGTGQGTSQGDQTGDGCSQDDPYGIGI